MGKIVYLMGKSSSGKDTVFKELMKGVSMNVPSMDKSLPYAS